VGELLNFKKVPLKTNMAITGKSPILVRDTLPETNSSQKMNAWKMTFLLGPLFSGALAVSFRGCKPAVIK